MRKTVVPVSAALVSLALSAADVAADSVPLNSLRFEVVDYIYAESPGRYTAYNVVGFRQPVTAGGAGVKPKMRLLPELTIPLNGVTYASPTGMNITPTDCAQQPVRTIRINVRTTSRVPTQSQRIAVGAATRNVNAEREMTPWGVNAMGQPVMWAATPYPLEVSALHREYSAEIAKRQDWANEYDKYDASMVTLENLRLDLQVDGDVVSTARFDGSLVGTSGSVVTMTLRDPDAYTCNRIVNGAYDIIARYRFNDSGTAEINARFEVRQTLKNFIQETQIATARSKSSGWKVLGIGSRRSTIKSSLESSMTVESTGETIERTVIVLSDANDEMVERFESVFFPRLSKLEAINNHLAAAEAADASNNPELAKAHRAYVDALRTGREDLETDAVGAAAALKEKDYATFIAKGVRFSDSSDSRTDNFRRTLDLNVSEEVVREWSETRSVTKSREATTPIFKATNLRTRPYIGILNGGPISYRYLTEFNGFEMREGLIIGATDPSGPLAIAGILPGMIVYRIGSTRVSTLSDLERAMMLLNPGQRVSVELLERPGFMLNTFNYQLGKMFFRDLTVGSMPMVLKN